MTAEGGEGRRQRLVCRSWLLGTEPQSHAPSHFPQGYIAVHGSSSSQVTLPDTHSRAQQPVASARSRHSRASEVLSSKVWQLPPLPVLRPPAPKTPWPHTLQSATAASMASPVPSLAQQVAEVLQAGTPFCSFEVFPPATQQGLEALYVSENSLQPAAAAAPPAPLLTGIAGWITWPNCARQQWPEPEWQSPALT